jgi:16S rRNA processing protein RimM
LAEYFKIGKFVAVYGLKGELILKHELGKKTSLRGLQKIFIEEKKDSFLPWFIEGTKIKNEEEVFVKLEGVVTREAATPFTQKEVWFTGPDLKKFSAKSSPINLLGYTIINEGKPIGKIEVLIPLNEETLGNIDHKKKEVNVSLPEGLLEIYLGP